MMTGVRCPQCLSPADFDGPSATPLSVNCPRCQTAFEVQLFPALKREPFVSHSSTASAGDEAVCFFHEDKRADSSCDLCGRFLCSICDLRVGERHLCPSCFGERARDASASAHAIRVRMLPARLGLWIALSCFVIWPIGIVGGPVAIYLGVRGLRQPGSITGRRTTIAAIVAIVLGLIEVAVWVIFVSLMISAMAGARL